VRFAAARWLAADWGISSNGATEKPPASSGRFGDATSLEIPDGVGWLTLDRPTAGNSLDLPTLQSLYEAILAAEAAGVNGWCSGRTASTSASAATCVRSPPRQTGQH
jgi:hypothetical protein